MNKNENNSVPRNHFHVEVVMKVSVFSTDFQTAVEDSLLIVKKQTTPEQRGQVLGEQVKSVVMQ